MLKPGGKLVNEEVAEAIVRFVAGGSELRNAEVEPSLLSLVCRELNNARVAQKRPEISADVLAQVDAVTGQAFVDIVLDQAEQKGTGRWTVQNALELGVPITGIAEATFARSLSGHAEQRAAAEFLNPATLRTVDGVLLASADIVVEV